MGKMKTKKMFLLALCILCLVGSMSAADVTNPSDTLDFSVISSFEEVKPQYGTFETSFGSASNPAMKPNISTRDKAFRLWPGNTFTVTGNAGLQVEKVTVTFSSSNKAGLSLVSTEGSYADGVWTGPAASVSLSGAGSGYTQTKISKIVIEYSGSVTAAVNAPRFSKEGVKMGEDPSDNDLVLDADTISISADDGCAVYYTLDGSDPTAESSKYTTPIVIASTTTIKAVAINEEGKASYVKGFTYYINKKKAPEGVAYYESFDRCLGYNGNDGNFSQPNSSKTGLNTAGTLSDDVYAGLQCLYLAYQYGQTGSFTTPELDSLGTSAELKFRTGASSATQLMLSATNAQLDSTVIVPGENEWKNVTVKLSNIKKGATVKFEGRNLFIDEVTIQALPEPDTIMTTQPEGTLKVYDRSGYSYYANNGNLRRGAQTGTVSIVYGTNGDVYIKDPLAKAIAGSWVKAAINSDSTTITLPLGQPIYYDANQKDTVVLAVMDFDDEYEEFSENTSIKSLTFTVKDDKITLNGTSSNRVLAAMWKATRSWAEQADYNTVYTLQVAADTAVTVPDNLQTDVYKLRCNTYVEGRKAAYNVTLGFDGDDMYIKGLFTDTPNAWIKGAKKDGSYVFKSGQYLGKTKTGTTNYYMIAVNHRDTKVIEDLKLTYNDSLKGYTTDQFIVLNTAKKTVYLTEALDSVVISKEMTNGAYSVPYKENFSGGFDDFTVIDANEDGVTWNAYMGSVEYGYSQNNAADDWLVSPKIALKAGKYYKVTVRARSFTASEPEKFEVKMGAEAAADKLTSTVIDTTTVATEDLKDFSGYIKAAADENIHFGIHAVSDANNMMLRIAEFSIEESDSVTTGISERAISEAAKARQQVIATYNLNGQRVDGNARGVVIRRYTNGATRKVILK